MMTVMQLARRAGRQQMMELRIEMMQGATQRTTAHRMAPQGGAEPGEPDEKARRITMTGSDSGGGAGPHA